MTNTSAPRCGHCGAFLLPTDAVHYPVRRGEIDSGNPLLGTVVDGKYRLQGVLGRGGLGTVFRAQHIGSLMTVAVKLLHPRFAERPEYRRALLPEARRAATVTHEHCARLLDVGEADEGVAYLAMELVDGKTLEQLVRPGPLAPSHAADVLAQVAEALVAIHAAGLVHCDLSPRNVMVSPRGGSLHVKVLDFGIARSVTMAGRTRAPNEFAGFVNPAFAAPELLAGGDVDPRADLYSFGTLAWVLLTGRVPVDDSDPRRAAAAVAAGELQRWSPVSGVPRRLVRLIRRCLSHDPGSRPPSAAAVSRELALVRGARRPALVRGAVAATALGVIAMLAVGDASGVAFLRPVSGSPLALADGPLPVSEPAQDLNSAELHTLGFHYGGFGATRLRADIARSGVVLPGPTLRPEVDPVAGTLRLSVTQTGWRDVVQTLVRESRDGPVDLMFVVPGSAPLGTARLRLDDERPSVVVTVSDDAAGLSRRTRLAYELRDAVGVVEAVVHVKLASGRTITLPLPVDGRDFPLGEAVAGAVPSVGALGEGEFVVVARDRAGNSQPSKTIPFATADVAAPVVDQVAGRDGQAFLPAVGGRVSMRVLLSDAEPGCELTIQTGEGQPGLPVALTGTGLVHTVDVVLGGNVGGRALWKFVVTDATGNRTAKELQVDVRDRTVRPDFQGDGRTSRWLDGELVLAGSGAAVTASLGGIWVLDAAHVDLSAPAVAAGGEDVHIASRGTAVDLEFPALPPGLHMLRLVLREGDAEQSLQLQHTVPVRVLPPAIEVRVPSSRSRYLDGLLQAGMLQRREGGLVDGVGWRLDAALRPYLRGVLKIGSDVPVSLPLPRASATEPLLPVVVPVPGHNVFAVELTDVLERPVRIVSGDDAGLPGEPKRHVVIADFWWHEGEPAPIGEEVLVEFGQPASFDLRFSLPFQPAEAAELQLAIAQRDIPAARVTPVPPASSVVTFEVPYAVWSVAAQLADKTRDEYAAQIEQQVDVHVKTPAGGDHPLKLRLRTTRSTLRPMTLAELKALPPGLGAIRLLPVLAPSAAFAEPVPPAAPPRASFRPQVAVAVRNMVDLLLQDREFACGEARELVPTVARVPLRDRHRCVHFDDPLGAERLKPENLLPAHVAAAPADAVLTGVNFFQAYSLCRLLGIAVAGDPDAFRLPLGCELEMAGYTGARFAACNAAAAHGRPLVMARFLAAQGLLSRGEPPTAAIERAAGDVVPTTFGAEFVGLDFGVREWVFDLPHIPGAEMLMREWIGDRADHLDRVEEMARGVADPMPDPVGPLRHLGVVRGLPLGQRSGLVALDGTPLTADTLDVVPDSVPGVLRTEQLRRDGGDLLASAADPRLASIGFRVVGIPAALTSLRGRR